MEMLGALLCIILLFLTPYFLGLFFGKKNFCGTYISGFLFLFGSFELIAMGVTLLGLDFWTLSKVTALSYGILLAVGILIFCFKMVKRSGMNKIPFKEAFMILPVFCLVASVFFLYAPKLESWYMVPETVITILDTGSLHGFHPLTGQPLAEAVSLTDSLLNLPAFYACLSEWFHVDTGLLLFHLIPLWILFVSFLVFYKIAGFFFKETQRGRILFLWAYGLVLLFGDSAYMNEPYQMLHYAYEGRAVLTGILLPYGVYLFLVSSTWACSVRESKGNDCKPRQGSILFKWLIEFVLVFISGCFVMGLDYGLGLLASMAVISILALAFSKISRKVGRF